LCAVLLGFWRHKASERLMTGADAIVESASANKKAGQKRAAALFHPLLEQAS